MKQEGKSPLGYVTVTYWLLLFYIIAALTWWFIELEFQNREMMHFQIGQLDISQPGYLEEYRQILALKKRETTKFILEGLTFFILILIIAVYVYRTVRNLIRYQQREQNFMMAITHELKTPIAVAKLNLETLKKHNLPDSKREKLIDMALQETTRLDDLANNILLSARIDSREYIIHKEPVGLSALIHAVADDNQQKFPERDIRKEVKENIVIQGDSLRLEMLVNNLIGNAIKYTSGESPVICRLYETANAIILEVADEGSGIPDKEKKNIFRKFYRLGNENTRSAKGTGLGLYLCYRIAKIHDAQIEVKDNLPSGSIFKVSFKK